MFTILSKYSGRATQTRRSRAQLKYAKHAKFPAVERKLRTKTEDAHARELSAAPERCTNETDASESSSRTAAAAGMCLARGGLVASFTRADADAASSLYDAESKCALAVLSAVDVACFNNALRLRVSARLGGLVAAAAMRSARAERFACGAPPEPNAYAARSRDYIVGEREGCVAHATYRLLPARASNQPLLQLCSVVVREPSPLQQRSAAAK